MTRIQLGELAVGRQALEGADLAPGTEATLRELRQRPHMPHDPIPPEILNHVPQTLFALAEDKGAAGGPSGMTNEHLTVARFRARHPSGWENCWSLKTSHVC